MIIRNEKLDILITFTDINVRQTDLFSTNHHKWLGTIQDNKTFKKRSFQYQCPKQENPDGEDFLYCLLQDYISAQYLTDFKSFCDEFGYESEKCMYSNVKEYNKVQSIYNKLLRYAEKFEFLFNEEQIEYMTEYFKEW